MGVIVVDVNTDQVNAHPPINGVPLELVSTARSNGRVQGASRPYYSSWLAASVLAVAASVTAIAARIAVELGPPPQLLLVRRAPF